MSQGARGTPFDLLPDTLAVHAGQRPDPQHGARAVPIYQTTSYVFPDADHAAQLFDLRIGGHIYSRISNPTVAVLEERLAALEGGVGAVCTASGQAALHLAITTLMGQGGHIVASRSLYGGSYNLLQHTLPRFGITASFVDPRDPQAFARAIRPETRLLFGEVIGNPGMEVLDVAAVADIAHAHGLPLMIDSTFTPPVLCRPLEHGADLVMHSVTKFIGGHGVAIGGAVIDGGRFDWAASGRFPTITEDCAAYNGLNFLAEFGPAAFVMRARAEGLRDFGAAMSPANAFYLLQGVETLHLRMARHVANAGAVAAFLQGQDGVDRVSYPGLAEHPDHDLAMRLMPQGCGAVLTFDLAGGRAAGAAFIAGLQLCSHLANIGDAKTLVIHPASTTHQQMSAAELRAANVGPGLIRISVGIEDPQDIISDLKRGLAAARRAAPAAAAE